MKKLFIALVLMATPAAAQVEQGLEYDGGYVCRTIEEFTTTGSGVNCRAYGPGIYIVNRKVETPHFDFFCIRPTDDDPTRLQVFQEGRGLVAVPCLWARKRVLPARRS